MISVNFGCYYAMYAIVCYRSRIGITFSSSKRENLKLEHDTALPGYSLLATNRSATLIVSGTLTDILFFPLNFRGRIYLPASQRRYSTDDGL